MNMGLWQTGDTWMTAKSRSPLTSFSSRMVEDVYKRQAELCTNVAVMYAGSIIEYGSVKKVFKNPLHPYTTGLLGAIPNLYDKKERLTAIPGTIADPYHLPEGCSFCPRCEERTACCHKTRPLLIEIEEGHSVACWKYVKESNHE